DAASPSSQNPRVRRTSCIPCLPQGIPRMRSIARSRRTAVLWAAFALALAAPLQAASPRDELLRFVPDDVGFCFVMQDLRVHATELADSPFVEQLRLSPVGAALRAANEWK